MAEEKKEVKEEKEVKEVKEVKEEKEVKEVKEEKEVKVPKKFQDLVKNIESLSVLELSELVKILEEKFGVSAAAPMAVAPMAMSGTVAEAGGEEEKSSYNVELKGVGDKKIEVIKAVRDITGKGLKEAKDLVDAAVSAPQVIKEDVPTEEAKEIEKKLTDAGAQVELK